MSPKQAISNILFLDEMKPSQLGSLCLLAIPLTGCISPSQILMDHRLAELCAKDSGVTIYEAVTLPASSFSEYGKINFFKPANGKDALGPLYDYDDKTEILVKGTPGSSLSLVRFEMSITRKSDNKLLARGVSYARYGGDLFTAGVGTFKKCPEEPLERLMFNNLFKKA